MEKFYNLDDVSQSYNDENYIYRHEALVKSKYTVEKLIDKVKGKDILDLGLGHGFVHESLSKQAKSYDIIEGSKRLISEYKTEKSVDSTEFNIICSYFEEYIPAKKYDLIIISGVLTIVENPQEILKQYREYLNDGGRIIVIEMNAMSLHRRIGFETGIISDIYGVSDYQQSSGIRRLFTLESIKILINNARLEVLEVEGIFLKPITSKQMVCLGFNDDVYNAFIKAGRLYPELCNHIYLECKMK